MKEDFKNIVIEVLGDKANLPCPRCAKDYFEVVGISNAGVSTSIERYYRDRAGTLEYSAPVALVVCKNCGYLMQHSLKILGLLSKVKEGK